MIRFENVYKRYPGGREALAGVSFNLERGEFAFLTGPSGAGKSTLLRLIALIERPTRGTVLVNNQNTARLPRRKIPAFRQRRPATPSHCNVVLSWGAQNDTRMAHFNTTSSAAFRV